MDEHNHALAALRYLIAGLDARRLARRPFLPPSPDSSSPPAPPPRPRKPWLRYDNEALWTRLL